MVEMATEQQQPRDARRAAGQPTLENLGGALPRSACFPQVRSFLGCWEALDGSLRTNNASTTLSYTPPAAVSIRVVLQLFAAGSQRGSAAVLGGGDHHVVRRRISVGELGGAVAGRAKGGAALQARGDSTAKQEGFEQQAWYR